MSESLYRVLRSIPELTAEPGDVLIVRPGRKSPFVLQRAISPSCLQVLHTDSVAPIQLGVTAGHRPAKRPHLNLVH